ncbi:COG4223 family protein [Aerobium aerolatum]|uniref:Uncharacterized conserved protein n=1 Tax=Aquamicrobium aerolatum DSM 21857 TaxID=1121003 RepID=A0A1I3IWJ7_9HYPH|nr:hypothetical protein [Aquamicrobium aerolatum]SFI52255.1 Uncharacterized conserved protein [Aquamicrobium aerolatum DSM 21857]
MVKTPHTRHSKSTREPVTIDLAPGDVAREKAEAEKKPTASAASSANEDTVKAEPAKAETVKTAEPAKPEATRPEPAKPSPAKPQETASSATGPTFGRNDKPSSPPPSPAPKPRSSVVPGAIAGGVVALLVAGGLSYSGLLAPQASVPQDNSGPAIAALESELATLRNQIAQLPAPAGDNGETTGRIEALETRAESFAGDIEALRNEIAQAPDGSASPAPAFDATPLEERIAALETNLGSIANGGVDEAALDQRLSAIRDDIAAARQAQVAADARLSSLEQSLTQLTGKVEEAAQAPSTALIVAASSLKAAIDRGTPFLSELETYATLNPDAPQIAELRNLAASGVPTRTAIAAEAEAAANAMIAAARPVDPNAGVLDRLASSAMGLVQVRPVGMVEGAGVPETTARIEAAVQAGDYARAITEVETLPGQAQAAGATFIERLKARMAADQLVDEAMAAALRN